MLGSHHFSDIEGNSFETVEQAECDWQSVVLTFGGLCNIYNPTVTPAHLFFREHCYSVQYGTNDTRMKDIARHPKKYTELMHTENMQT